MEWSEMDWMDGWGGDYSISVFNILYFEYVFFNFKWCIKLGVVEE
jgi:hypothetical protein